MASVFTDLISVYTNWPALSSFLKSADGGYLRIDDLSTAESPYAIIRYVKGRSDLSMPHVRAFRSVVWDTLEHRPVSVTPFKSVDGESLPTDGTPTDYRIEQFYDGVLIGMWWDKYNNRWRIHTRSTIDGNCRFYSQTTSFAQMFWGTLSPLQLTALDPNKCYAWILQHPENRIVCPVKTATVRCLHEVTISSNGNLEWSAPSFPPLTGFNSWSDVLSRVADWNARFGYAVQGIHVSGPNGQRWKVRTPAYNMMRTMRGNTPRRDYVWLDAWRHQRLSQYLAVFPEERISANRIVDAYKRTTGEVYHWYVDVFKARTVDRKTIPVKFRSFVFGLHTKYMTELKPQNKTLDWKAAVEYMNTRDVPQMLYVINYETRYATRTIDSLPIEPAPTVSTNVLGQVDTKEPLTVECPPFVDTEETEMCEKPTATTAVP